MTKTHLITRISVSALFIAFYLAFLLETAALAVEFAPTGLALRLAALDAHNFIFFPIAGLLALTAFWRPTVLVLDALAWERVKSGRIALILVIALIAAASWALSAAFSSSNARSVFEIAPEALSERPSDPALQSIPDTLVSLKILANGPEGLAPYRARCDDEWLNFSPAAEAQKYCLPLGEETSVAKCCQAKAAFADHINALHAAAPSQTYRVHGLIMPVKITFLFTLLAVGVLLARLRPKLWAIYGERVDDISFGLAVGGLVMLTWPLLNAAYLETLSLLTGAGSSSAYTITAPLIALGFGIWALLLVFFHLRSYPSQIEYAARIGGFVVAAVGVLRYEEITGFFTSSLGIGGGVVEIVVFAVAIAALLLSVLFGLKPQELDFPSPEQKAGGEG